MKTLKVGLAFKKPGESLELIRKLAVDVARGMRASNPGEVRKALAGIEKEIAVCTLARLLKHIDVTTAQETVRVEMDWYGGTGIEIPEEFGKGKPAPARITFVLDQDWLDITKHSNEIVGFALAGAESRDEKRVQDEVSDSETENAVHDSDETGAEAGADEPGDAKHDYRPADPAGDELYPEGSDSGPADPAGEDEQHSAEDRKGRKEPEGEQEGEPEEVPGDEARPLEGAGTEGKGAFADHGPDGGGPEAAGKAGDGVPAAAGEGVVS